MIKLLENFGVIILFIEEIMEVLISIEVFIEQFIVIKLLNGNSLKGVLIIKDSMFFVK